jgi:cobalt-precorrin-5B (C1)-methyltransferase
MSQTRTNRPLRHGFTTGSAASAAAKAATLLLLGADAPTPLSIPCPPPLNRAEPAEPRKRLEIRIERAEQDADGRAWAEVVKDGGDDPDATHGALIRSQVSLCPELAPDELRIEGGEGVGRVTRPGLPVPVGQAAINPAPLAQIRAAVREAVAEAGRVPSSGLLVTVSVKDGERIATKTMNPRLGVLGGISILGRTGTVKPFSHEAYQATIHDALSVASAAGLETAACSTGRTSERLLAQACPELPELCFVQIADFYGYALRAALDFGFQELRFGCYFGKFVKMAQGLDSTHAHAAPLDFALLAERAQEAGLPAPVVEAAAQANTARQVWEMLETPEHKNALLATLGRAACLAAKDLASGVGGLRLRYYVFDFNGDALGVFEE